MDEQRLEGYSRAIAEAASNADGALHSMSRRGEASIVADAIAAVVYELRALRLTLAAYEETTVVVEETTDP